MKNGSKKVEITVIVSKTTKAHARVVTSGNRIKLFTSKNKLHGWLLFNVKKGTLNWDGYKMTGVKTCGFIQDTWDVVVVMKNGQVWGLPNKVAKGETRAKYKICENALTLNRDTYGFVYAVKMKNGDKMNIGGKEVESYYSKTVL